MSSQSILGLPPVSSALKATVPFLQRANELQTQDPVMAYWCAYHAAQLGISLKAKDPASRDVLFALLNFLEQLKKRIGPSDALDIESVSSAYVENFAFKVFASADNEDRSGSATRATAKKFLAAAHFLEVLKVFPKADVSESVEEKIKYAKWKAADIAKAFREGRRPTPGPAGSSLTEDLETTLSVLPHGKDVPISDNELQSSVDIEHSPSVTPQTPPLFPRSHIPPRFVGHHLESGSSEYGVGTHGGETGEASPGSWSTVATPGTAQGPPDHWEQPGSPTRGACTRKSALLNRKPWVSEELEGKDESEYLGTSMDTAETPTIVSGGLTENTAGIVESVPAELSNSRAKASTPSSATFAEQTHVVERQQSDWAMDELANNHRPRPNSSPTHHPGLIPNLRPDSPIGAADLSHQGYVPLPTAPRVQAHPDPYHSLYPPPPPSQQHLSPPPPVVELTPSIIAKAQKHCRFAISSLDYEDADQARKELRAALAILGDT